MMRETTGMMAMGGPFMRIALVGMALALGACQTDRAAQAPEEEDVYDDRFQITSLIGSLQTAPDEFSVLTKRPLELPQDFTALPVPEPGKISSRDPNPQADARAALAFDTAPVAATATATAAPSVTEAAILSSAGPADPTIRATLAGEQAEYEAEQNLYLLDRVFPALRRVRGDLDRDAIDAEAERLRLLEEGITPQRAASLSPAASLTGVPAAPGPVDVIPVPAATIPAPAAPATSTTPTFGVLVPETTGAAPELIYLPE